jgi:hypothetical protein
MVIGLTLALVATVVYFRDLIGTVIRFEYSEWKATRELRLALEKPRSVILTEYAGDVIINRVVCAPEQILALRKATNKRFWPFSPKIPLCFEPHHSITIVRADGSTLEVYICFLCGNFAFHDKTGVVLDIPPYWSASLLSFFRNLGMSPRTYEKYNAIERGDAAE